MDGNAVYFSEVLASKTHHMIGGGICFESVGRKDITLGFLGFESFAIQYLCVKLQMVYMKP